MRLCILLYADAHVGDYQESYDSLLVTTAVGIMGCYFEGREGKNLGKVSKTQPG